MTQDYTGSTTLSLTWDEVHRDTCILAQRLAKMGPFKGIVAVARGGLVPAAILARQLDLRLVDTVCIASYDEKIQQSTLNVLKPLNGDGDGWLIVDDLVDSGKTAVVVKEMLPNAHYATVYAKPEGRPQVDSCVVEVDQNCWLVFPWDEAAV